ncbi:hypothetical protein Tco_0884464 [Tanacetum coccineum]
MQTIQTHLKNLSPLKWSLKPDKGGLSEVPKLRIEAKNQEKEALEVITRRTNPKIPFRPISSSNFPVKGGVTTRKSKPLPEGIDTHPQDSGGNKQPLDGDTTSTTPNEGTAKTMPHPEGSLGDKDSRGNIPPTNMEPIHTPIADLSWTGGKYRVDETQSTRLRYQSLTKNKGKTSSEVEPDTEPLKLQTYADIKAFLLFDDELDKESDEEEVLVTRDDIDEDPPDDKEVRTPSTKQDQPEPSDVQQSASDSSSPDLKKFDNILPLTERQLIKYLRKMPRVLFNRITEKQCISSNVTEVLSLVKGFDFSTLLFAVKSLRDHAVKQEETALKQEISSLKKDTSEINSMMAKMGENANTTATEEPPSHTEGETEEPRLAIPISSIPSTIIPPTQDQLITSNIIHPESSQATLKIDKGKGIATVSLSLHNYTHNLLKV